MDSLDRNSYGGTVWRSIREGRDLLACWCSGGRWDDGTFDVLCTSETRQAAIGERRFQETAEACAFLGAAEIVVPNVRTPDSKNLVIFCEQNTWIEKEIVHNHGVIDLRQPASR